MQAFVAPDVGEHRIDRCDTLAVELAAPGAGNGARHAPLLPVELMVRPHPSMMPMRLTAIECFWPSTIFDLARKHISSAAAKVIAART